MPWSSELKSSTKFSLCQNIVVCHIFKLILKIPKLNQFWQSSLIFYLRRQRQVSILYMVDNSHCNNSVLHLRKHMIKLTYLFWRIWKYFYSLLRRVEIDNGQWMQAEVVNSSDLDNRNIHLHDSSFTSMRGFFNAIITVSAFNLNHLVFRSCGQVTVKLSFESYVLATDLWFWHCISALYLHFGTDLKHHSL